MSQVPGELSFSLATVDNVDICAKLERDSYPPEEAASREKIEFRITNARDYFMVTKLNGDIIGFVNGTLSREDKLTHESMSEHIPDGHSLNIHSVVVREDLRRRGIALKSLVNFTEHIKKLGTVHRILLIAKEHTVSLYQKAGYMLLGPSDVHHGGAQWYDLQMILKTT